jgi:hypothetical protein
MSDSKSFEERADVFMRDSLRDCSWKVKKSITLIDKFVNCVNKNEVNLLDVGGGSGLLLKAFSSYIEKNFGKAVHKFALDPSQNLLQVQKKTNPDLKKALIEDICKTSLSYKEIDLTLMIDVLEHVPYMVEALKELKRISSFVLFKVPLEDCLLRRTSNLLMRGKPRRYEAEVFGHINVFNLKKLRFLIEKHAGKFLDFYFTNVFEYFLNSKDYKLRLSQKFKNLVATYIFKFSPTLCSLIFYDHVMILVECY